ncbi:RNA-binding E3 ubiquitin-protein ligase MEX3C [Caerostris extrusa]|uniref:RNA-binding E3 ubiquitin-protein ligase MEX3C n=1 Tax=Caerostris extrusa TaxID=172846 RepID=A0AAV4RCU4_CAEEX|nr:RNA-binding E3 ubiquitin-protein ligase MEX3C [Caerostris extrusa]
MNGSLAPGPNSSIPGQTTIQVHGSSGNNSTAEDDDFHVNGIDRVFTAATVANTNFVNTIYKSEFGHSSPSSRESNNILTTRLGDSPTFEQAVFPSTSSVWSDFGPVRSTVSPLFGTTTTSTAPSGTAPRRSNSLGSADSGLSDPLLLDHPPARRIHSDPLVDTLANFPPITAVSTVSTIADCFTVTSCSGTSTNSPSTPTESISPLKKRPKRDCAVCFESEVVAALVPCGHNMYAWNVPIASVTRWSQFVLYVGSQPIKLFVSIPKL